MKDSVREAVVTCFQTILKDEPWQDFGFRRRPKYGALIQRFRPAWKVALEKKIMKEMLSVLTAAYVTSGAASMDDVEEIVDAYTATPDLVVALGYPSKDEARCHLQESIERYLRTPPADWSAVLLSRIDPNSLPDEPVAARLFLGCAQFGMTGTCQ